jgi:hypothetical protein
MSQQTLKTLRAAEEAVSRLVDECRKPGPLYKLNPKATAQVSRTAKWLLNAITVLQRELKTPSAEEEAS